MSVNVIDCRYVIFLYVYVGYIFMCIDKCVYTCVYILVYISMGMCTCAYVACIHICIV